MKKTLLVFALIIATLLSGCSKENATENVISNVISIESNNVFMNNETNIATVNIESEANVSSVELFINGISHKKIFSSPYRFELLLTDFNTGTHNIVSTVTFEDGTQNNSPHKSFKFKVRAGDDYQGGLVIKVSADGFSGTIAAKNDLTGGVNSKYKYGYYNGNYQAYSLDDGVANTNKFIGKADSDFAAIACLKLDLNGYDDWYLPALQEFDDILTFEDELITYRLENIYWTSTIKNEDDYPDSQFVGHNTHAELYGFGRYAVSIRDYDIQLRYYVRPCRRFSSNAPR